jgi:hypothetical protein
MNKKSTISMLLLKIFSNKNLINLIKHPCNNKTKTQPTYSKILINLNCLESHLPNKILSNNSKLSFLNGFLTKDFKSNHSECNKR